MNLDNHGGDNKRILTCLVIDKPGVLVEVASLFRRRGFNITSLAVGHSERPGLSRMAIIVEASDVEQVGKQLWKLINVIKVTVFDPADSLVARELALIKVKATAVSRGEIIQLVTIFRGNIVDVAFDSLVVELVGGEEKIDALIILLKPFGIEEIMRSGLLVLARGAAKNVKTWSK